MSLNRFSSGDYQVHNAARLAHLASLGLDLSNKKVLEVGSGPGDHTGFYLERGCTVVATDGRDACVGALKRRWPQVEARRVDMNDARFPRGERFDIVHCYGLLYHLQYPSSAILEMSAICDGLLLLETCVTPGSDSAMNLVKENVQDFAQATTGTGCRPTRPWIWNELKPYFPYVYQTRTQPNHPEFPLDWKNPPRAMHYRAVFVASRTALDETKLSPTLLEQQTR